MARRLHLIVAVVLAIVSAILFYFVFIAETTFERNYRRIEIGMSVAEVEAILGAGTPVKQSEVPRFVVPVNPNDAAASADRARRAGVVPTARDYPVREQPLVEGDQILEWEDKKTGERIWLAFKEGKVCQRYFWRLSGPFQK